MVSGTRFSLAFLGQLCVVFDWIVLILAWFERSLHKVEVTKLSLTIKTDDVTSAIRDVDPDRQAFDFLVYK